MKQERLPMILWIFAFATMLLVRMGNWNYYRVTGRLDQMEAERVVMMVQGLIAAAPFIVAAVIARIRVRAAQPDVLNVRRAAAFALGAFALTGLIWTAFWYSGFHAAKGTGANIGFAWLMLLSPVVAGAILFAGLRGARPRAQ